jgi:hypothetical protein
MSLVEPKDINPSVRRHGQIQCTDRPEDINPRTRIFEQIIEDDSVVYKLRFPIISK